MAKSLSTRGALSTYFLKIAPESDSIISPLSAFVVSHFSSPVVVCVCVDSCFLLYETMWDCIRKTCFSKVIAHSILTITLSQCEGSLF